MAGIRTSNRLTALAVDRQRKPGLYADGTVFAGVPGRGVGGGAAALRGGRP